MRKFALIIPFSSLFQVNGIDVSQCSHEEAVQVFLGAEEPITVEVKRRSSTSNDPNASPNKRPNLDRVSNSLGREQVEAPVQVSTASIGVQTDDLDPFPLENQIVFDESPVSEQIVNIFDECLVPDVDIEVS